MKTRVAMKVLKRHAQGHYYRLSTFRAARRQYRRANQHYGISRLALVADSWRAFANLTDWMARYMARFAAVIHLSLRVLQGGTPPIQQRAPVSKTGAEGE